ncbi:MAG: DUF4360 domain-containing protein [bacterium]|nr:DUF4360 domain-containing protein [bacterium]
MLKRYFNLVPITLLFAISATAQNSTTAVPTTNSSINTTTTETPTDSAATPAFHGSGAELGNPTYAGTGCPSNTVSASLSPDATSMSVLFDSYTIEAGGGSFSTSRKYCDITIPIFVPNGYQVGIIRSDYRGFNDLPSGAQSQFKIEYFLAGQTTNSYTEVYDGPITNNFLLQDTVNTQNVLWSNCGYPANFRINTDISVFSNVVNDYASTTLDTADISINDPAGPAGLQFYFVWQPCATNGASSISPLNPYFLMGLLGLGALVAGL